MLSGQSFRVVTVGLRGRRDAFLLACQVAGFLQIQLHFFDITLRATVVVQSSRLTA